MAIYDRAHQGYRVFIGDLGSRVGKFELEKEFDYYGPITDIWVARNPPGFAFLVFKYSDDAEKVVRDLDGRTVCGRRVRIEHARPYEQRSRERNEYRPARWSPPPPRRSSLHTLPHTGLPCPGPAHAAQGLPMLPNLGTGWAHRSRGYRSRSRERKRSRRSYTRSRSRSRDRRQKSRSQSRDRKGRQRSVTPDRDRSPKGRQRSVTPDKHRSPKGRQRSLTPEDRAGKGRPRSMTPDRLRSPKGRPTAGSKRKDSDRRDSERDLSPDVRARNKDARSRSRSRSRGGSLSPLPRQRENGDQADRMEARDRTDRLYSQSPDRGQAKDDA